MEKYTKKHKRLRDELVCVPSGFVREDGTEIMAWTLKSLVEGIQEENDDDLTKEYEQKDASKVRDILNKVNQIVKNNPEKIKLLLEILKYILLNSKSEEIRKEADKIIKEYKGGEETVLNMVTVYNKALDEQREKGQKAGDRQRQIKTAKRLIKEKMKLEFIAKITDLSIEEIEKLK